MKKGKRESAVRKGGGFFAYAPPDGEKNKTETAFPE